MEQLKTKGKALKIVSEVSAEEAASAYRDAGSFRFTGLDDDDDDDDGQSWSKEETEEFLWSIVGDDPGLSRNVVADVLSLCEHDVEEALKVLLGLPTSSEDHQSAENPLESNATKPEAVDADEFKQKGGYPKSNWSNEEAEGFLWSIVGDDSGLSLNIVSDVLCWCEYDVEKALDVLLELSTSSEEQSGGDYESCNIEDAPSSSNIAFQGKMWNNSKFKSGGSNRWRAEKRNLDLEHPKEVLESVFTMPPTRTTNEADLAYLFRKIATVNPELENNNSREAQQLIHGQERSKHAPARETDEKTSWEIFTSKNRVFKNRITVDLHGQHVKPAINILKMYLQLGACLPSMWSFRVITGYGKHSSDGKPKIKKAVVDLLDQEGIAWSEENKGALLVTLKGRRSFSFLNSGSDNGFLDAWPKH